ncbi:MAG: non-hydrolyzing UDP-N-acetylglucosamine 2-epimerase [Ktedonobacteraceae bacterium]
MIKVLSILGTRPEAVKMAPVIKELEQHSNHIVSQVCVTAQHRQMLDQVLSLFKIVPDYDLNLMHEAQSPMQVAAAVFTKLEPILTTARPDWVLIQGDTTTVMAASIAAFYAKVKVGHVEAGLRTFDKTQPFPEEVNRRVAGVVADLHFVPTARARNNLLHENVPADTIHLTGNPVIDALHTVLRMPYNLAPSLLTTIPLESRILLVTAHRRENFGLPLAGICKALQAIAYRYQDSVHIVYPVHLNPYIWEPVHQLLGGIPGITLVPPLDYLPLVQLLQRSYLVLTDSGGLQEEAPSLGKPVLVLRSTTERPEAIEAGTVKLIGTRCQRIVDETARLLDDAQAYWQMAQAINPYGDGQAAQRIVNALLAHDDVDVRGKEVSSTFSHT